MNTVAIVGLGPRGLSVLERLLIRLDDDPPEDRRVVIYALDAVEHGPGRVWRTDQPPWLAMNTTASEMTIRSPGSRLPADRFGDLSSFRPATSATPDPHDAGYPSRREYGRYLREAFARLRASAPSGVDVCPVLGEATRLRRDARGLCLTVGNAAELWVDKAVLATGHVPLRPTDEERAFHRHALEHPACTYIGQNSAADMPLDRVPPGAIVAVRGLGLTFYDVVRSLTLGRGGVFVRDRSGRLRYHRSGREPVVVAGSRRGLPFLARPRPGDPSVPAAPLVVFTGERVAGLRAAAEASRGTGKLAFAHEVEPWIEAEVDHAYYAGLARRRGGDAAARRFSDDFLRCLAGHLRPPRESMRGVVERHDMGDVPPLDLDRLANPFRDHVFDTPAEFRDALLGVLRADVAESRRGTSGSPLKAALDVLRRIRPLLPSVVDFGGLLPASHADFLERFEPLNYVLSAGPPDRHVEELVALVEAGVVDVVGPGACFEVDSRAGCFAVESPGVTGSRHRATVLVDARVPATDIGRTASPLIAAMVATGMACPYVNTDPRTGDRFDTGGLAVTPSPYHVLDSTGSAQHDIYAIGVATDRTRWFTQVGTGRPGETSPFCEDADAIAADIARGWRPARPACRHARSAEGPRTSQDAVVRPA